MSKQKNHSDQNDLYHTIEFTDEDKAKLRSPNVQPIDDDYFAKKNMSEPKKEPKEKKTKTSPSVKLSPNFIESIKEKTSKSLQRFFKPTYEAEYDLDQLDDLEDYNQFSHSNKEEADQVPSSESIEEPLENEEEQKNVPSSIDEEKVEIEEDSVEIDEEHEASDLTEVSDEAKTLEETEALEEETLEAAEVLEETNDLKDIEVIEEEVSSEEEPLAESPEAIEASELADDLIEDDTNETEAILESDSSHAEEASVLNRGRQRLSQFFNRIGQYYSGEASFTNQEPNAEENDKEEVVIEETTNQEVSSDETEPVETQSINIQVDETIEDVDQEEEDTDFEQQLDPKDSVKDNQQIDQSDSQEAEDLDSLKASAQTIEDDHTDEEIEDEDIDEEETFDENEDIDEDDAFVAKEPRYSEEEIEEISNRISHKAQEIQATQEFEFPIAKDMHVQESLKASPDVSLSMEADLDDTDQDSQSILGGATWLTIGSVISRIIGALYVIPWSSMFGEAYVDVNSLYSIGYRPYTLFLAIATAGFPSAIAKQMSYYHSQKEYRVADKLFKNSMLVMLATGLVSALLLFIIAPGIAAISSTDETAAATVVIRSLTPALLILPAMSLLRGYFQGFNDMKPTAISQIIEQISRVAYLLIATYAVLMIMRGEVTTAIVHSTFAAFIGALAALLYLVFLYLRSRPLVNQLVETSRDEINVDLKESIIIMIKDSIPFILLGSGIIIAQFIDQITFSQILQQTSSMLFGEITQLFGTLSVDVDKLVMIIVSVAVALASSLVPTITSYFARRNYEGTSQLILNVMILFSFIMIPAALGMASISDNIYYFFFANGLDAGPDLLVTGAIASIVLGAFTVISTILQSMNFRRVAVRFLIVGLIVKALLQYPFVALMNAHGALLATMIGLGVSTVLMWIKIHRELEIDYGKLNTSLFKIIGGSLLMAVSATMWNKTLNLAFGPGGRGLMFGKIIIVVIMAVIVYGIAMALTGMLGTIIGDRHKDLQERMRII